MVDAFVIPRIGLVRLEDRLVAYDGPLLFTLRADNGGLYIASLANEEDDASMEASADKAKGSITGPDGKTVPHKTPETTASR